VAAEGEDEALTRNEKPKRPRRARTAVGLSLLTVAESLKVFWGMRFASSRTR
jgi:hypothetical protein